MSHSCEGSSVEGHQELHLSSQESKSTFCLLRVDLEPAVFNIAKAAKGLVDVDASGGPVRLSPRRVGSKPIQLQAAQGTHEEWTKHWDRF